MPIANWRSGTIQFRIRLRDPDGNLTDTITTTVNGVEQTITTDVYSFVLKTPQAFNPSAEFPNMQIIDSLSEHNIGYFDGPIKHSFVLGTTSTNSSSAGVLDVDGNPVTVQYGDHEFLTMLHLMAQQGGNDDYSGIFDLEIIDVRNLTSIMTYQYCIIATSNPSDIIIDNTPIAEFTCLALAIDFSKDSTITYNDLTIPESSPVPTTSFGTGPDGQASTS